MISNPRNGWCDFDLDDFHGGPSYLTDVPADLLRAFIALFSKGCGVCYCDEEGTEFTLVMTLYYFYIIEEKEKAVLHVYRDLILRELTKELISDIEKDIDGWAQFIPATDGREIDKHKTEIIALLNELKSIVN